MKANAVSVWLNLNYGTRKRWNKIVTFHRNDWCRPREEAQRRFPEVTGDSDFRILDYGKRPSPKR